MRGDELSPASDDGALLRALVDKLPAMVAYWDTELRCRFANEAYKRWFGVSPESLRGKHISELLGPLYELNLPYIQGALRGVPQEFEREIPDPSGGPSRHSLANYIPDVVDGVVRGFFVLVTDISEVKRAQLALRESEERFRLAIDEAPIGMALVAPDGRFVRVNRALSEIVGYSAEELSRLTFQHITHREDLDIDVALAGQIARGEIPRYKLAKRCVKKDGAVVDVMVSGAALRAPDGSTRYFIAQIEDVTAEKQAADALRQSEERFALALDGADLASWDWNIETGEVVFNRRWAELRGLRLAEVEPHVRSWLSGIHPDDRARVQEALDDYFEGRSASYETEHRVRTKSGEWRWVLDRGKVFSWNAAGRATRMAGTELDVTERKRIETEQRFLADVGPLLAGSLDYEQTLSTIAELCVRELADLCIVDVVEDAKEVRRLTVASRDPSKADLCELLIRIPLDRSRPHLLGPVLETKQPFVLQRPSDDVIRSFAQGEEHLRALRAIGIHSMMAVPLVARDALRGAIAFISSTSSRVYGDADVRLARELAQRASLSIDNARLYRAAQRATRARDEVLGIVAHDLRNPLSTIVLHAALMRRKTDPERRSQRAGEAIERAARRMDRLIRDLLDVTSIEAGKLSVTPARVPAKQILADCIESQRGLASSASIELRLEVPPELPDVRADRDRLLQVFENLLGNALKFTKRGGRVTVGAIRRADEVLFWVRDTGGGIPTEHVPHVFDRFWQSDRGSRRGAGLGLPIVKGIVEAHGGHIWLESAPGEGSSFFFTMPVGECTDPSHTGSTTTR